MWAVDPPIEQSVTRSQLNGRDSRGPSTRIGQYYFDSAHLVSRSFEVMSVARPEDQILICVARRSLDVATAERLRQLLRRDLDWQYLTAMAHRHCLIPLLCFHVISVDPLAASRQVMSQLQDDNHENTRHSLFLTGELLKIMDLLAAHGIQAIPFKGPTLALCAYGDVGLRQFSDLDLLVHKRDVLPVRDLLVGRGFKASPELSNSQEAALLRFDCSHNFVSDNGVCLDVHWGLVAPYLSFGLDMNRLWDRLEPIAVGGKRLLILSPEDLLMALCLHGYTHFWERLGWICDIAGLIQGRKDIEWELVLENASRLGSQRILSLGLFLARELLAAPIPEGVWKTVQADPVVRTIAAQVQEHLFAEEHTPSGISDGALLHLRMRERKRDRLRSCLHLAATPRVYDWMLLPLPDSLFFLYYLLRPLRLAGKYGAKLLKGSDGGENSIK